MKRSTKHPKGEVASSGVKIWMCQGLHSVLCNGVFTQGVLQAEAFPKKNYTPCSGL